MSRMSSKIRSQNAVQSYDVAVSQYYISPTASIPCAPSTVHKTRAPLLMCTPRFKVIPSR